MVLKVTARAGGSASSVPLPTPVILLVDHDLTLGAQIADRSSDPIVFVQFELELPERFGHWLRMHMPARWVA